LYAYSEQGFAAPVDPRDVGNIDTVLEPCRRPVYDAALAETLATSGEVEQITRNDGEISFRVRGLEFARTREGAVLFGLVERRPLREHNLEEARRLARDIGVLRQNGGSLSAQGPELWLESQVRKEVEEIDASLLREPIYGQVPAFAGGERGVLDLLAVDRTGRLAVIELKASSDLHLPMQALDYWARVKWHIERGEFAPSGYFPGIQMRPEPPRLLLVAPALEFHPTTETILRYFSPAIDVEHVGLALEWRTKLEVLFRASGAASA
jgi:hypothetical protein